MARTAVDLYCGSGGVTAGLKAASWHVIAACDNDPIAASTYRANHKEVAFIQKDIMEPIAIEQIGTAVGNQPVDLLVVVEVMGSRVSHPNLLSGFNIGLIRADNLT